MAITMESLRENSMTCIAMRETLVLVEMIKSSEKTGSRSWYILPPGVRDNNLNATQILLNDLDVSSSHMDRLVKDLLTHPSILQHYSEDEYETVKSAISSLSALVAKFRSTIRVSSGILLPLPR